MLLNFYFKTTCNARPHLHGPIVGLKIEGPLHVIAETALFLYVTTILTICFVLFVFNVQMYRLNADGQISVGERCVDSQDGVGITIIYCPVKPSGPWRYDEVGLSKNNINMQFLYSALSSNELKILYLFLFPANAHTRHPINSATEHTTHIHAASRHGLSTYNYSFLGVFTKLICTI